MLIAYDVEGQLGNQLWAYSNLIATGILCQVSVVIILNSKSYDELASNNLKEARSHKIYILRSDRLAVRIVRKISDFIVNNPEHILAKIFSIKVAYTGSNEEAISIRKKKSYFYLINSWKHRHHNDAFYNYSEVLKDIFHPESKSKNLAKERIENMRKKSDIIVAVHIRRGDYKTFCDGRFYFEDKIYIQKMQQIYDLLHPSEVGFAIFSNENIDTHAFGKFTFTFSIDNTPIGDMWAISLCDYIIGPLSTFSMWASFWNNVPLLYFERNTEIKTLKQFSPIIAQDEQLIGKIYF